jgi:pyruvate/2-oxoglutarate dehydrogenase complex dihydrolipoamide acyltransferase (E2) component
MPHRWGERWKQNEDGSYSRNIVAPVEEEVKISKAAQELADEIGLDVSTIEGTGAGGGITKADVEAAAEPVEVP